MALSGFHYLAFIMPNITSEDDKLAIEARKDRTRNTYYGTLSAPYTGLKFSFEWFLKKGATDLAAGSSQRTRIRWVFKIKGKKIDAGGVAINGVAGQSLLTEISIAEAGRAEAEDDRPNQSERQLIQTFETDITAAEAAGQILPTGGKTLAQLYLEKGI